MDVYLVPVGPQRYELYCEIPDDPEDTEGERQTGFFRRLVQRFREMIAEAERERRQGTPRDVPRGWVDRIQAKTMRWVAEAIAEQKLLWHLRKQDRACLHYPDDMQESDAVAIRRDHLTRDLKKHRKWLVIDSILMVIFGVALFAVPGPNLVGYYFAFRVVGHYLSLRGATRGVGEVAWINERSGPLTELRRVLALDPVQREPRVHAVAETLRLEHLVSFFQRSAVST
jgi:Mitochondrial K+-H+ exchange-related